MTTETPRWFKSSYSENGGVCIEVATNLITTLGVIPSATPRIRTDRS
ncbi:hypothetical protein OEIGOIKO_03126 [Streptomyces chrestomyceticus JCM 4735]|uniref:DUF397 domain-containing protein n=1 Tax=Streptomyces chrestomyceticus JCM 4735 TaxID=1306181 RepID=A0A7U9KV80_9ACTN|nr:hypothetical protein OEIGOIKO_03126 [Streptomyces chrestomyceticus JCM 4735]